MEKKMRNKGGAWSRAAKESTNASQAVKVSRVGAEGGGPTKISQLKIQRSGSEVIQKFVVVVSFCRSEFRFVEPGDRVI